MIGTMHSIKEDLKSIKEDNEKLLKARAEQEELNEILLKSVTNKIQQGIVLGNQRVMLKKDPLNRNPIRERNLKIMKRRVNMKKSRKKMRKTCLILKVVPQRNQYIKLKERKKWVINYKVFLRK